MLTPQPRRAQGHSSRSHAPSSFPLTAMRRQAHRHPLPGVLLFLGRTKHDTYYVGTCTLLGHAHMTRRATTTKTTTLPPERRLAPCPAVETTVGPWWEIVFGVSPC